METKVWTVLEFAKILKISDAMAYRLVRDRRVPSVRVGDRYLISAKVVDSILAGEMEIKPGRPKVNAQ